jgi:hypothetical protein
MTLLCDSWITSVRAGLFILSGVSLADVVEARGDGRAKSNATEVASVDSEHMFGFTIGSDIGSAGEIEIEGESDSGVGKGAGRYFAAMHSLQLKYTPTDSFRIAPHVELGHHAISAVSGMAEINRAGLASGGVEFKYRMLNRADAPFGLTFGLDTSVGRIDAGTGQRSKDYALDFSAAFDREIIKDRLFGAINLIYAPSWALDELSETWERSAVAGIGGAVVGRIGDGVYLGGEVRYLRAYETAGLSGFSGDAVFAGPSLYVMFTPRANMTIAWNAQVAGRADGDIAHLDLKNFERHQVRVRFGFGF